jgi:hypothetical protein
MPDVRHRDHSGEGCRGRGSRDRSANRGAWLACHHPEAAESDGQSATAADHPEAVESGDQSEKSGDPEAGRTDAAASEHVAERVRSGRHHEHPARSADPEADRLDGAACPRDEPRVRLPLGHDCSISLRSGGLRARLRDGSQPSASTLPGTRAVRPVRPVRQQVPEQRPMRRPQHQPGRRRGTRRRRPVPKVPPLQRPGPGPLPQPVVAWEQQRAGLAQLREPRPA